MTKYNFKSKCVTKCNFVTSPAKNKRDHAFDATRVGHLLWTPPLEYKIQNTKGQKG